MAAEAAVGPPYSSVNTGAETRSPPLPHRPPLLDERPLRLARVLAATERRADLLLTLVGLGEREVHDLAHAPPRLTHRERRVGGDRVGRVERSRHELVAGCGSRARSRARAARRSG